MSLPPSLRCRRVHRHHRRWPPTAATASQAQPRR